MQSRTVRYVVAAFLGLVVLFGVWSAWQAWQVNKDLTDAVAHAKAVQRAVEDSDDAALDREVKALQESSSSAADRTSGVTWSILTKVPVFGDDADGVRLTSEVLDELSRDGIEPLSNAVDRFDDLLPKDGGVDIAVVKELSDPVNDADQAFAAAADKLDEQDASGFTGALNKKFTDFRDQVNRGADALHSARIASDVLPTLLGDDESKTYLLAFQNNAEVRGAGGLPGAVAYIKASNGKLTIDRQVAGGKFEILKKPALPLSDGELDLYGDVLGNYFVDAGMTPDVPREAALMKAHSDRKYPKVELAGVLTVDTVTMSYILDATGPITVDGVEVNGDNVVDELLHNAYLRLDTEEQDKFFADVATAAFDKFTDGAGSPTELLKALSRATGEHRVAVHLFASDLQEQISGTEIAGEFVTDPAVKEPQIAVTFNDTTGAKMSYFLRAETDVNATSCVDGTQSFVAKVRLRSTAPADAGKKFPLSVTGGGTYGVTPGEQIVTVRVFAPAGGDIGGFELNSKPADLVKVDLDGRPAGMTYIELKPGQTVDLSWQLKGGKGQVGNADLTVTPTIEEKDNGTVVGSACQ